MELNDKELFEAALSDKPVEAVETPEPVQAEPEAQPRDDHGRFASKAPEAPAVEAQPEVPAPKDEAHVPSWRLREVNEAREAAERRATEAEANRIALARQMEDLQRQFQASQQKPQEPVDWYADPNAAMKQQLSPYEQRLDTLARNLTLRASRAEAVGIYGRETVLEAEKAAQAAMQAGDPEIYALGARMRESDDPVGLAVQWYQRDKLARETGGDLTAYRNKVAEDLLKDQAFLARAVEAIKGQPAAPGRPNTVVQLPPSINRATSAASPHDDAGSLTDSSLYAYATR